MKKTDIPKLLKAEPSKNSMVKTIFWLLMLVFLFILCELFIPVVRELFRGSVFFLLPLAMFGLLGIALIVSAIRKKLEGRLKKFLILTGASSSGFFVCILLHNIIYGLFIYFFGPDFWERIGLGDEPFFFLLAIFICPIGFLIGAIGSIILLIKERRR